MTKAVFTTKETSRYDDLPEQRYHFLRTYLNQVAASRGDWIVYYEPRRPSTDLASRGGRQAYFATAQVTDITEDPSLPDHFYASIDSYLPFDHDVPFLDGGSYYESKLVKGDGSTNKGAFGRAVRHLSDREYDRIVLAGFAHVLGEQPRPRLSPDPPEDPVRSTFGFGEAAQADFAVPDEQDRALITQLVSRPFRDKAFSTAIKAAYRDTCAMTGLKIINGGGRSEVQAAHIRPVADRGPDSVRNGLALSGTIHWMFDRGLLSVDDDYFLLVAKGRMPDVAERLLVPDHKLVLPDRPEWRPHPKFLEYHRREVFKG